MLPTALIPVRLTRSAKRRLAHVLSPDDRYALVHALLRRVVEQVELAGLATVALAPPGTPEVEGVQTWRDERPGLNAALSRALERLGTPAFVIHADLPRLRASDVQSVVGEDADVVVARARDGGTNGLLLRRAITPAFGPGSALVHASRARRRGLSARVMDVPGFALDVDDEAGLSASGAAWRPGRRP